MMSLQAIQHLADDQAKEAAEDESRPYVYDDLAEVDRIKRFPFPNLGSYTPDGWQQLDDEEWLFCNKLGGELGDGRSLSPSELRVELKRIITAHPNQVTGFAIVEEGQFQLYIAAFTEEV